jgi:glyoxylase-like metal-dependent hydrolase (beta-lactamase superfamily II)
MAEQIAPNIYRITASYVNLYLVAEDEALTLIDTGTPRQQKLVWQTIAEIGRQRTDLTRILITHADTDHAGSLAAIQSETGAKVYASAETAVFLQKGKIPPHLPWFMQFVMNNFIGYKPVTAEVIEIIKDGDTLPILNGLQVVASPGHTMEHHSFFSAHHGILFAGDALNTNGGQLQPSQPRITADNAAARRSAIQLLELAPAIFACGHGDPAKNFSSEDTMKLFNELRHNRGDL